jgi:hypothetical protein
MIGHGGASPDFDGGYDMATDSEIQTFVQRRPTLRGADRARRDRDVDGGRTA